MVSLKRATVVKRIGLLGQNYTHAWTSIIQSLQREIESGVGDLSYDEATVIVRSFTHISDIRRGLMTLINQAYEVGQF